MEVKELIKKATVVAAGMLALVLLTGCQVKLDASENETLKKKVSQLEQQISDLQQSQAGDQSAVSSQQSTAGENSKPEEQTSAADSSTQGTSGPATTHTMEELTSMVEAYIEKANAAAPAGTSSDMNTFFSFKQEEKQINDLLDTHETELERLYRQKALSKDEYNSMERELEKLEDRLDDAEDRLERTFGIDD